jgi:bifunctional non-homologous end joining protein LigD
MRATPSAKPFTSADWLYEIKFAGYRCMARAGNGPVELRTKSGIDCTAWYPEVAQALAKLPDGANVIDGEACVLDDLGRSDFGRLRSRASHRGQHVGGDLVTLCAFDLLFEDGRNIMNLPLVERKTRLAKLLNGVSGMVVVGDLPADAELVDQAKEPLLLQGFMAKHRFGTYMPGVRSPHWLKFKSKGGAR